MVINHLEKLFVTSDASTIVTEMDVYHPAAKLLVMAAKAQAGEVGDGTNLVRMQPIWAAVIGRQIGSSRGVGAWPRCRDAVAPWQLWGCVCTFTAGLGGQPGQREMGACRDLARCPAASGAATSDKSSQPDRQTTLRFALAPSAACYCPASDVSLCFLLNWLSVWQLAQRSALAILWQAASLRSGAGKACRADKSRAGCGCK